MKLSDREQILSSDMQNCEYKKAVEVILARNRCIVDETFIAFFIISPKVIFLPCGLAIKLT